MSQPEESGLERDYCAGQLSLRDMAEIYGISEGAIRKRAKKHGWVRSAKTGTQKGTQVRKSGTQKSKVRTKAAPANPDAGENGPEGSSPSSANTKPIRGARTDPPINAFQPRNQVALKHGGYARRLLLSDEVSEDARELALEDELFRLRAANLMAAENIGRLITRIEDATDEQKKVIRDEITAADKAMMRNTVRIESLEHTKASISKMQVDTAYRAAATEKVEMEIDVMKDGDRDNAIVVHNALPIPGR
ncbi:hypothetical protein [Serratia liquefaciens]|uniref:Terminase n=1 Tax=Serratia liquefaciens TaxID=614 RepID=A0ABX7CZW7_SERLI|nr:hypothetical protein [Serratia liquefaciens]QQU53606.1 hypothetical protein I6I38_14780 [Serratia liquefaciens]